MPAARTFESGLVKRPLVPMESGASLDANGAFVFPVGSAVEGAAFIVQLRNGTNAWFGKNFKLMLDKPLPVMFRASKPPYAEKTAMVLSGQQWNTLTEPQKASYRGLLDLRTDYGMSMVFDTNFLDREFKKEPFLSMPGQQYFRQAIFYTKQGNSAMPLGNLSMAWTKGGFGKWSHICPDVGLRMVFEAMKMMESLGLNPGLPNHFPHPIYKPPDGSPLEVHHDQMDPLDLVQNLRDHVASPNPSMSAWVAKYGVQMLTHLQGGTGTENGATFVVGPMTPAKMLICLQTFAKVSVDGDYDKWIVRTANIHFVDVEKYLPAFNQALQQAGQSPIGLVPIAPTNLQAFLGGFGLGFPVGMWHGSFSNSGKEDQAVGKGSRITITMPLTLRDAAQKPDPRIRIRLRAMAVVSTEGLSEGEYKQAGSWLASDTTEYATGRTHWNPQTILEFICCPAAATALGRPIGPYYPISVKPQSVANYIAVLEAIEKKQSLQGRAWSSAAAAAGPSSAPPPMDEDDDPMDDVPLANLLPAPSVAPPAYTQPGEPTLHTPPSPDVLIKNDVRLVKVKQPWAEALVTGQKNVENRKWFLNPSTGFPAWVLVVASKSVPTKEYMKDYISRLTYQGGQGASGPGPATTHREEFELGKIVGMVRVVGCYPKEQMPIQSVWYNPPDIGWVVDEAWPFEDPIDLNPDDKFQTQVSLSQRQVYLPRLLEEMSKLEPTYR
jgi:hypothetical protein